MIFLFQQTTKSNKIAVNFFAVKVLLCLSRAHFFQRLDTLGKNDVPSTSLASQH